MAHSSLIIFSDPAMAANVAVYERELPGKALSEKRIDCQTLCEDPGEASMAKVLLLFALGGGEVQHEVRRTFPWAHRGEKTNFVVQQLQSGDPLVTENAIDLLGVLKERLATPAMAAIFDVRDAHMAACIIRSMSAIGGSIAVGTILKGLTAKDPNLLLLAMQELSLLTEDVPWTVFRPLLTREDPTIRREAAFAICIRKAPQSASLLLAALGRETDRSVRRDLIHDIGMVPSIRFIPPLLEIAVHDNDQKARLMATRALDRLQGLVHSGSLYRFRRVEDVRIRAEVLSRLGKFGSDIEKHKAYLRGLLHTSGDVHIVQACLQALGNIAEREDRELLESFLTGDPVVAYSAALALIRVSRQEDAEHLVEMLVGARAPSLKQVFLKYLIRRRGFGMEAHALLRMARLLLDGEDNINVRYLTFFLLRFAPSEDTLALLLTALSNVGNQFEREAIETSLKELIPHHPDQALSFLAGCDDLGYREIIRYIPGSMSASFYRGIAEVLFKRCGGGDGREAMQDHVREMIEAIIDSPVAVREFLNVVPDDRFLIISVLQALIEHADRDAIDALKGELVDLLLHEDAEIRTLSMMLILSLKDASVLPHLIEIAQSDARVEIRSVARHVAKALIGEGAP
jgi:HEAT repeat protein